MKASGNMHGQLRVVQRWPFYLLPLIAALVVVEFFSGRSAGMAALIFLLLYLIFSLVWLFYWNNRITREIVEFASNFDRTQKAQMEELALPYALMSITGEFVWMNKAFRAITGISTIRSISAASSRKLPSVCPVPASPAARRFPSRMLPTRWI